MDRPARISRASGSSDGGEVANLSTYDVTQPLLPRRANEQGRATSPGPSSLLRTV